MAPSRSKEAKERRYKKRRKTRKTVIQSIEKKERTPLPENDEITEDGKFKYPIEIIRFLGQIFPSHFEFNPGLDTDNLQENQIVGGVRNSDNLLVYSEGDVFEVNPNWKPK